VQETDRSGAREQVHQIGALHPRVLGRSLDRHPGSAPAGRRTDFRVPAPAFAVVALVLALPSLWAAGVLAVATDRLTASEDALARGQLGEAAAAARSADPAGRWRCRRSRGRDRR